MAEMTTSLEAELDRRLEQLIVKMVNGTATDADRLEYAKLAKRRALLMYPPSFTSGTPLWPVRATRRDKVA